MHIVKRPEWGAAYADGFRDAPLPAKEVWLHHSVTVAPDLVPPFDDEVIAMQQLEAIGQQRFGGGVSYTFAVMPTGNVYEGHSIGREGAHTKGRNSIARAIVLVGNYDTHLPTDAEIEAVAQLLVDGYHAGWWTHARLNGGHQQAPGAQTACPGRHGMEAVAAINSRAAQLLEHPPEEDMPLTEDDIEKIAQRTRQVIGADTRYGLHKITKYLQAVGKQLGGIDAELDDLAAQFVDQLHTLPASTLHTVAAGALTEQSRRLALLQPPAPAADEPAAEAYEEPAPAPEQEELNGVDSDWIGSSFRPVT